MKRKVRVMTSILVLVLVFASGCSSQEKLIYDKSQLEMVAGAMIDGFSQMNDATFEAIEGSNDYALDKMLFESQLPVQREAFIGMLRAWRAGVEECGAYIKHGDFTYEESNHDVRITTTAEYKDLNATLEFVFNEKMELENLSVNAETTTSQILQKAGKNTLIGMGTVFAVLIFISFIISLLKFIPSLLGRADNKKTDVIQTAPAPKKVAEIEEDDLELAAVIAAAIAEVEGIPADGFVVRSIKRRKTNRWN